MATTPAAPQGVDLNTLIEQIRNEGSPGEPVKMTLGGQTLEFSDIRDAEGKLNQVITAYNERMSAMQQNIAALQAQTQQQQQPVQPQQPVEQPAQGQQVTAQDDFNFNKWVKQFTEDPRVALQEYEEKYSPVRRELTEAIVELQQKLTERDRREAALVFTQQHPEFQDKRFVQPLTKIMETYNLPFTSEGLDAAYRVGLTYGTFQPPQAQQPQGQVQQQAQQTQMPVAPPVAARGVPAQQSLNDQLGNVESLDAASIEQLMARIRGGS